MTSDITYSISRPDAKLLGMVDSFWILSNKSSQPKEIVILPDGRVDLFFSRSVGEPLEVRLMGLATQPDFATLKPGTVIAAVSFNLLAMEYVLKTSVGDIVNGTRQLPEKFWDVTMNDAQNFNRFKTKMIRAIRRQVDGDIDSRKQKLFDKIYSSQGELSVNQLADQLGWSSRQINRYFNQWFGLSLKTYCNILRFRASFGHIKLGKFFPEQNFADQSHFIREIKRLSGVNPKALFKNQNDRFIQFSTLRKK